MEIKNKYIIEVGHVSEVYGPVQALRNYLAGQECDFTYVAHPFAFTSLKETEILNYSNGKETGKKAGFKKSKNQFLQWMKDFIYTVFVVPFTRKKADLFVGVDNLNAVAGIILKAFGRVDKVAYYIIDHMDRRFKNPLFNFVYEFFDMWACRGADSVWALSERMAKAKEKKFKFDLSKMIVVPVGVELDKVPQFDKKEKAKKKTMVLMSYLDETKGVQVVLDAMAGVLKEVPAAKLIIIGTGPYEQKLKEQAAALKLGAAVEFKGAMNHTDLFNFIPHERIGLAPYSDDPNNYTYYADPTKPKEYLGCGLPIVITDVPWIASEVSRLPMGAVCKYTKEDIAKACVRLLNDDSFYLKCLENALKFASELSWQVIYSHALSKTASR